MNKVIIINLNGIAYQLEEDGYEALRAYLDSAARRLEGNPDKGEIIADIEQSIADKFRSVLGANKTVVVTREVQDVIAEMGPVQDDSFPAPGATAAAAPGDKAPSSAGPIPAAGAAGGKAKRLYRLREGAKIGGVCNGLAAYFGTDVTLIRILFAIVGISFGAGVLLYIALMVIIPWANTPAEVADAHGDPSTAEDIIQRAKEGYYSGMKTFNDPANYRQWKRKVRQEWRQHRRDLRDAWKRNTHDWNWNWPHRDQPPGQPHVYGWWFAMPFAGLLSALLTVLFILALLSLVTTHAIFGFYLPYAIPFWLQIVGLIMIFNAFKWPLRAMRYGWQPAGGSWHPFAALLHTIAWIWFIIFAIWLLHHNSHAHQALDAAGDQVHDWIHQFKEWWDRQ